MLSTTTYRIGYNERCRNCGSVRSGRGIGEYQKHDNGNPETLINCSDCHRTIACECGKVYPISESEKLSPARINGIAKACTACMPSRHQREMTKAADRIRLTLARHIAMRRARMKRTIYRDVAVRYLRLFGGSTFSVQTDVDACEIYLENAKGMILGKVSSLDLYPKPPAESVFASMPF